MTVWIYPYARLFGDVELRIEALHVDDSPIPARQIDADRREVRLIDLERSGWERVALELVVTGPPTELAEREGPAQAFVIAHCAASNSRQAIELEESSASRSIWRGQLELDRSSWFGRIDLRASLVATVDRVADRIIGDADPWTVRLDDVPPPPVHGAIRIEWHNFSEPADTLSWLKHFQAEPVFLRLDDEEPILYLNRAFAGLKALLDRKPSRESGEQALHDQTRATIAIEAWGAMFNAALQAIEIDEVSDEPAWPAEPWKRAALEIALERMFSDKTQDDALIEAAENVAAPESAALLQQKVTIAVSEHVGSGRLLRAAINALGKDLKEE